MNDQIIEKRPSSPIATALLAVAAVAMIAACVLGCMLVKENSFGVDTNPTEAGDVYYAKKFEKVHKDAQKVLKANESTEDDTGDPEDDEEG